MKSWKKAAADLALLMLAGAALVMVVSVVLFSGSAAAEPHYVVRDRKQVFEEQWIDNIRLLQPDVVPIEKTYTLNDHDLVAPKPGKENYGEAGSPEEMAAVLNKAEKLLGGQKLLFTTQTEIQEGTAVRYYLDDTIFAVTWKQVVDNGIYTFSEVKIAHPSQIRRFFAEGTYGSNVLHTTTEMAETVNAVVASSGDYYGYRNFGIVVNGRKVFRHFGKQLDTCYIDDSGDLLFTRAGELMGKENVEQFVEENNVRFSLSFGPVMIQDGQVCVPGDYYSGEINSRYARAALCQMGQLHYLVVTANNEAPYYAFPTVKSFAQRLQEMGVPKAYALDGGQTASIVMDNQLVNHVSYGSQRKISDILYFATAVPQEDGA